jgi:hypothetical protein
VLVRPSAFYRMLATRVRSSAGLQFACFHWGLASILLGPAAWLHVAWYQQFIVGSPVGIWPGFLGMTVGTFVLLWVVAEAAAKLTSWEATYRGLRMPTEIVKRALYFHAPHYLPVAFIAAATIIGYILLLLAHRVLGPQSATTYLYALCGEVIAGAVYLFYTYWIAMRNIMYANG